MQTFRRSGAAAARQIRQFTQNQGQRSAHDAHGSTHGHAPSTEHLGRGFYIAIALIPASMLLYRVSAQGTGPDSQPAITRMINSYDGWRARWQERNDLHTQMMEQAASDRNLFLNSRGTRHVELKFPEVLNSGSPWNVPAGHGGNIDYAIARFEKENYEAQAKKLQDLKDGNIRAEKPYTPPAKTEGI